MSPLRNEVKLELRAFGFWLSRATTYPLVSPDVIQIPMTQRCNLRCKMCNIPGGAATNKMELSKKEIFDILNQAKTMGIRETVLTGGEPLLRDDLVEVCAYCKEIGLRSIVTTNGTIIDSVLAQRLVCCGLDHLHFSLDGLEETNDAIRGKGNFKKTIQAIQLMNALRAKNNHGPSIGIACTVMKHNVDDLFGLLQYGDDINVDVINFLPLLKDNAQTPNREESEFWIYHEKLAALDGEIEKIKNFRSKHISVYEEPDLRLLSKYYRKTLLPSVWKCFGGYKTIFICLGDDGSRLVYTCNGICGDLSKKTLQECWLSAEAMQLRKSVKKCDKPCLQSCYSRVDSESLMKICKKLWACFMIQDNLELKRAWLGLKSKCKEFWVRTVVWVRTMIQDNLELKRTWLGLKRKIDYYFSRILSYPFCPPEFIYLSLTNRCNLRCKMCSIPNAPTRIEDELSTKECKTIISQAVDLNIDHVIFSGGEPLLRTDIFELMRYAVDKKIKMVDIITNGILINVDVAKKLIVSGVNHITISIDGLNETGDFIRGNGVVKGAVEAIDILNECRQGKLFPTLGINFTIMDCNINQILPMVSFARDKKCNFIIFQPMMADNTNMQDRKKNELWVKEENIPKLKEVIGEVLRLKKVYLDLLVNVDDKILEWIPSYFAGRPLGKMFTCYEGIARIVITCSGDLWSCRGLYGNLRRQTLQNCWHSNKAKKIRQLVKQCNDQCLQNCVHLSDLDDIYGSIERFYEAFVHAHKGKKYIKELMKLLAGYKVLLIKEKWAKLLSGMFKFRKNNDTIDLTSEIAKISRIISRIKEKA